MTKAWPGLAAALLGAGLAWIALKESVLITFVVIVVLVVIMVLSRFMFDNGRSLLAQAPARAEQMMEFRIFTPMAQAVLATAVAIWLAVWLEPDANAGLSEKKLLAALFGALTGFLAAVFVKGLEDVDANYVAGAIKQAFRDEPKFKGLTGDARDALYDDVWKGHTDWSRNARLARAKAIDDAVRTKPGT